MVAICGLVRSSEAENLYYYGTKVCPKNKTLPVLNSKNVSHISAGKNNPLFQVKTG